MRTKQKVTVPPTPSPGGWAKLRQQYGCGPVEFTGADTALYERHLLFDNILSPNRATARELRGVRPLGAGRPLAALGPHGGHLRPREPRGVSRTGLREKGEEGGWGRGW